MSENRQRKLNTNSARGEQKYVYHAQTPESTGTRKINRSRPETGRRAASEQPAAEPQPAASPRGKKKKKKGCLGGCLKIFLIMLVLILIALVVIFKIISGSVKGDTTINKVIKTPTEYKGDVVNILVAGIDWEEGRTYTDAASNDGMTDMIMYVSFDVANKKIAMLQIPRNTFVGDSVKASNGQINSIAVSNGGDINVLAETIHDQLKLPVDYYMAINMQSLNDIVDTFGGIEVYVPHDIEYNGSMLKQGYQTMTGDAAEFFVRNRKGTGYERADLDRLNMQRYFYSGLLARFRTMTIWDVAKLMPVFMTYFETDVPTTTMVSLGVSLLQVPSSNIMISQMPIYASSQYYNENSVVVGAIEETADLLNEYFRTYTGEVPASEITLRQWHPYGEASDPNVQFMGALDSESSEAQQNNNLDGSNTSYQQ